MDFILVGKADQGKQAVKAAGAPAADAVISRVAQGSPSKVKAQGGMRYQLVDPASGKEPAGQKLSRRGKSLLVAVDDLPVVELEDFYADFQEGAAPAWGGAGDQAAASLVDGVAPVASSASPAAGAAIPAVAEDVVALAPVAAAPAGLGLLGGAAAVGGAAALAGGGGGAAATPTIDPKAQAAAIISAYAGGNGTAPDLSVYQALGVTGIGGSGQPSVDTINSVLADADIGSAQANTQEKVQAIVDAYQAILAEANGAAVDGSEADPTQAQYAAIGLNGVDTAAEVSLLGDVIGNKNPADVASVNQLQALADAVQAVMAWAADTATQTPPSVTQLQALTLKGVSDSKWQAIIDAIRASDNSGSDVSTVAKLQALVYATFSPIERLAFYADEGEPIPEIKDYTDAGVSGIGGAGQPTVSTINSVLADADIGSAQANTQEKVQAIVAAYQAILAEANGSAVDESATDPTQAQYATIGLNGVDTNPEVALLGDVIGNKTPADVATVAQLQTLADAVQAVMNGTAEIGQLGALGVDVSSLTAEKLKAVQNQIGADDPASLSALQQSVNKASNAYSAASDLIASYASSNGGTAPQSSDYAALGVSGIGGSGQPTVASINSALATDGVTGNQARERSQVQSIVNAYQAILAEANGAAADESATDPTQAQYAAIGVTGVDTAAEVALLGDVIGNKNPADVATATQLQALANAVQAVMDGTVTRDQLLALNVDVSNITPDKLKAVQNAIGAADPTSLTALQNAVSSALSAYNAASVLIASYAGSNGGAAPQLSDYTALGVTGIGLTGQPTINAINSALATAGITGAQADTSAKLQTIVDAYRVILDNANNASATDASAAQYLAVGVSGIDTTAEVGLLGSVIDGKADTDVDTAAKLQALANAVQAVMDGSASKAQLEALGLNVGNITTDNLKVVQNAIGAADPSSLSALQSAVTTAIASYDAASVLIATYAGSNGGNAPQLSDYTALGVTGIGLTGQPTVDAINSALATAGITGAQADTPAKLQTIVDAYRVILDNANNASATDASAAQYLAVGVSGIDTTAEVGLLGSVIDGKADTDVDTAAKLQVLADAVQAVMDGSASKAQLEALGVDTASVTDNNLKAIQAALAKADPSSLSDLQAEVNTAIGKYDTAAAKVGNYAQDNGATNAVPTEADYTALGVTGIGGAGQPTIDAINSALATAGITGAQADTSAKLQAIVDAYRVILDNANNASATDASAAQYLAVGVTGIDTTAEVGLLGSVIDGKADTDVDTAAKLQTLANAVQAVMDGSASKAQLEALGVNTASVTADKLKAINAAIGAADPSSLSALQSVVNKAVNDFDQAVVRLVNYANNNGGTTPLDSDYAALGVTGIDGVAGTGRPTVDTINSVLRTVEIDGADVNGHSEVQAIVNAYQAILTEADGDPQVDETASDPTGEQYAAIGVTGVDTTAEVNLLGDVIGTKADADVITADQVQALADAVQAVINYAGASNTEPTEAQLNLLGLNGVTSGNRATFLANLKATDDSGSGADTLAKLNGLTASAPKLLLTSNFGTNGDVQNFDVRSNLVLTAKENLNAVAGKKIWIRNVSSDDPIGSSGFPYETRENTFEIDAADTRFVTVSGNKITINPEFDLDFANNYRIEIDAGAFLGASTGQGNEAISNITFGTVRPQAEPNSTPHTGNLSRAFDLNGGLVDSYYYISLENIGSNTNKKLFDAGGGKRVAFVVNDFDEYVPPDYSNSDHGLGVNKSWARIYNFGPDDLLYFDTQGDNLDESLQVIRKSLLEFKPAGTDTYGNISFLYVAPPVDARSGFSGSSDGVNWYISSESGASFIAATDPNIVIG